MSITDVAQWAGIIIGSAMMVTICVIYFQKQVFGLGGVVMSTFGVLLMGLSIWTSFKFSYNLESGLSAEFIKLVDDVQELRQTTESVDQEVNQLVGQVSEVQSITEQRFVELDNVNARLSDAIIQTRTAMIEAPGISIDQRRLREWRRIDGRELLRPSVGDGN